MDITRNVGLQHAHDQVRAFHEKHGFPVSIGDAVIGNRTGGNDTMLSAASNRLANLARDFETCFASDQSDVRMLRAALICEELSELLEALCRLPSTKGDMWDAIGDLLYVVIGTAVTVGPSHAMAAVFEEIHSSNMTKSVRDAGTEEDDPRLRNKGLSFIAPNVMAAIEAQSKVGPPKLTYKVDLSVVKGATVKIRQVMPNGRFSESMLSVSILEIDALHRVMRMIGAIEVKD